MARIKQRRRSPEVTSCSFGGIDTRNTRLGMGAEDICNFCVDKDGTLRTRSGYRLYKSFSNGTSVRGVWEGRIEGSFYRFVLLGRIIYRLDNETLEETPVGSVSSGSGSVQFFSFGGTVYLLDGEEMRMYRTDTGHFGEVEAYVPLYGRNWHPTSLGSVYEEINLLSPKLRVHYFNSTGTNAFVLPYYADRIDLLRADGNATTAYTFTPGENTVYLNTDTAPSSVEIAFTYSSSQSPREQMLASQHAYVHSEHGKEYAMLYGNDYRMFLSSEVDDVSLSACRVFYPGAGRLYFRSDDVLFLGSSEHPVTSIAPLYDTLLVFTSERVYSMRFDDGTPIVTPALEGIGCHSFYGTLACKNTVLTVTGNGLYVLRASITHPECPEAKKISAPIDGRISQEALERCHLLWYAANDEIWMRDPQNTNGEVWVWNDACEVWERFENIGASFFFRSQGKVGFACEGDLMLLDPECSTDNGAQINSVYESGFLDLGEHEQTKRSYRALLCGKLTDGGGSFILEDERNRTIYHLAANAQSSFPDGYDFRAATHRFRFLRFVIYLSTAKPATLYRCDIYTKP